MYFKSMGEIVKNHEKRLQKKFQQKILKSKEVVTF